jgi:RNA polymerase primary sigma factor
MTKISEEEKLLKIYLDEISKYPLLSPEEEKELAKKIKEGDKNALKKLIESNLKLVVHFAVRFKTPGVSIIDLINEGNLALMKAAKKFDPEKDVRFSTYARWWIRNALWNVLTQKYPYSLKPKDLGHLLSIEKIIEKLKRDLKRMPTFEEIKEEFDKEYKPKGFKLSLKELKDLYEISREAYSFSFPLNEENELKTEDLIKAKDGLDPEAELIKQSLKKELKEMIGKLSEIERKVLILRFGLESEKKPMTITEVSKIVGLSRERVRQIEKKAINKLRKISQYYRLESFLN